MARTKRRVVRPAETEDDNTFLERELLSAAPPPEGIAPKATYLETPHPVVNTVEIVDEEEVLAAPPPVKNKALQRQLQIRRTTRAIYGLVHAIAILLSIRFVLQGLGADPDNGFMVVLDAVTFVFAASFMGLFGAPGPVGTGYWDWGLPAGILIYYLLAWIAARIAVAVMSRPVEVQ